LQSVARRQKLRQRSLLPQVRNWEVPMNAAHARMLAALVVLPLGGIPMFGSARAAEVPDDCVKALAQLEILELQAPVYREGPGSSRTSLSDKDRPGEVMRLQELAAAACSAVDEVRRQQHADANKLVVALSVRCARYREELAMLQRPGSRATEQDIERRRVFVAEYCPDVSREDMWLPDRLIVHGPG
jgi:hypothetical protein